MDIAAPWCRSRPVSLKSRWQHQGEEAELVQLPKEEARKEEAADGEPQAVAGGAGLRL